jgi:hypothetical protein
MSTITSGPRVKPLPRRRSTRSELVNAFRLTGVAVLGGFAAIATIELWPEQPTDRAPPAHVEQRKLSWARAVEQSGGRASRSGAASDEETPAAHAPQTRAITMQDGTVIWATQREREGSTPSRGR